MSAVNEYRANRDSMGVIGAMALSGANSDMRSEDVYRSQVERYVDQCGKYHRSMAAHQLARTSHSICTVTLENAGNRAISDLQVRLHRPRGASVLGKASDISSIVPRRPKLYGSDTISLSVSRLSISPMTPPEPSGIVLETTTDEIVLPPVGVRAEDPRMNLCTFTLVLEADSAGREVEIPWRADSGEQPGVDSGTFGLTVPNRVLSLTEVFAIRGTPEEVQ